MGQIEGCLFIASPILVWFAIGFPVVWWQDRQTRKVQARLADLDRIAAMDREIARRRTRCRA